MVGPSAVRKELFHLIVKSDPVVNGPFGLLVARAAGRERHLSLEKKQRGSVGEV
jgi:hypothetical protein